MAGEMSQSIKCLLTTLRILVQTPSPHVKSEYGIIVYTCNPSAWGYKVRVLPGVHWTPV